jgi:diguanylate cyclase (GGDEF)-like protein/PAS domain S-box-containing protein
LNPSKSYQAKRLIWVVYVGFIIMISLMVLLTLMTLNESKKFAQLNDEMYQDPVLVSIAASQANSEIISMHRYMKDVVLASNKDELNTAITLVAQHEHKVYQYLEVIKEHIVKDKDSVNTTSTLFTNWKPIRDEVIALKRNKQDDQAAEITMGKGAEHVKLLNQSMMVLIDSARNHALELNENSRDFYNESKFSLYSALVFIGLTGVIASFVNLFYIRKIDSSRNQSEENFETIFNNAEVSIWSEDFSLVVDAIKNLKQKGVADLREHLHANMDLAWDLAAMVKINSVNSASLRLFGAKTDAELISQINHAFGADAIEVFINELCAIWSNQKTFRSEVNFQALDGREIKALISFQIPSSTDDFRNIPIIIVDISEQKAAIQLLHESEDKYRAMFETSLVGMALNDSKGTLLEVNQAYLDIIGYTHKEAHKLTFWDITPKNYQEQEDAQLKSLKEKGYYGPYEKEYIHKDGHFVPVLLNGVKVIGANNEAYTWSCIYDITERKAIQRKLEQYNLNLEKVNDELALSATVFTHAREGIMITDAAASIVKVNDTFVQMSGYSRDELIGKNPRMLHSGKQSPEFYADMWQTVTTTGHWSGEIWNRRKNGEIYPELKNISAVHDANGVIQNYVAMCTDITIIKEHQLQLERNAHYDLLTNLPNRVLLADRLKQAMRQCSRHSQSLAVAFLDLDGFKEVNDTHGHDLGDELLIALSARMKEALREGDTLARFGGDEFVAVLAGLDKVKDCEPVLERLLLATSNPITVGNIVLNISASIGVTLYPQDSVDGDQLMRHADQAMYVAKQLGKSRYHFFDTEQNEAFNIKRESLDNIVSALERREFVLYYQPKVNMRTGKVIGVEALIRWQHPTLGLLLPAEFLPIIEGHAVSLDMGKWVVDTALSQISQWQSIGVHLPISVNISADQLQHGNCVSSISALLAAHTEVNPSHLELEVLETSALNDVLQVSTIMNACKALGVNFALDDFGTGYSSLTHLRRLPVSLIKIDQSFIRDMLIDPDDLVIVEGVIGLAKSFKRDVIAEGVETIEHGIALLRLGCELAQGYGIARPMPASDVPAWVSSWKPDKKWKLK